MERRDFVRLMALAAAAGMPLGRALASQASLESLYKVAEVLKASVHVHLRSKQHYMLKVRMVHVCVYAEKSFKDDSDDGNSESPEGEVDDNENVKREAYEEADDSREDQK